MNMPMPILCRVVAPAVLLLCARHLHAQQIDLSLHPTAVPDSFVVRATSTEGTINGVPNAVFTLRWELEAGGEMNNSDAQVACGAYTLLNYSGMVDIVNHRYFPLVLMGNRPAEMAGCAITPDGIDIASVRIRELAGCHHVELVQNAYTGMNNLDYYFSMGGIQMTGQITSGPLPGGECGPCEPPVISSASAVQAPGCNGPIDLQMAVEGDAPDFSWYVLYSGVPLSYLPSFTLPSGPAGPFLAVATNACGADSAMLAVVVDSSACVAPQITTATYVQQGGVTAFSAAATGTCIQFVFITPGGDTYPSANGHAQIPVSAGTGAYLAVAYNGCGADTATLWIDELLPCDVPQVVSVSNSVPPCQTGPLTLSATASGPGTIGYEWKDPFGTVVGTTANTTVPEALAGDYTITVTNECGWYWEPVPVVLDTAGVGTCVPPQILSISTNGPICTGDTLQLQADVVADGPCLNYQWSGTNVVQSGTAATMAPAGAGNYTLTVTNSCGTTAMSIASGVLTLQYAHAYLCGPPSAPLSMDSLINYQVPGGVWYFQNEPHSNYFDPATDPNGYYFVHHPELGCPVVRLHILIWPYADAGSGAWITVCSTDDPIDLFSVLGGDPLQGGFWTYGVVMLPGGMYDPAVHHSNTYIYRVDNPACSDTAHVVVTEIPATPWYADADGDGYGDGNDEVLACDPPADHVENTFDNCPEVYGLIGDDCDDGNPATVNDTINAECICVGDTHTSVAEHGTGTTLLWPNPNRGDVFHLQLPQATGLVHLTITDAMGRAVLRTSIPASSAPVQVQLPGGLAAGTYFVGIVTEGGAEVRRLVVER